MGVCHVIVCKDRLIDIVGALWSSSLSSSLSDGGVSMVAKVCLEEWMGDFVGLLEGV